jgi:serine/threonine protein kinase
LHLLSLIYNNIKLANIILNDNNNPIIIDFDNCDLNRQDLEGISGTWPWANKGTKTALPNNDLNAL